MVTLRGQRKRSRTAVKGPLKRARKSGLKGGANNEQDQDFIDYFKKQLRHLFNFLGPYACYDPNTRDQVPSQELEAKRATAWKFFQGLGVRPDSDAELTPGDIEDNYSREVLIYKLRYELDLLPKCEELKQLFNDTVGYVTLYFVGYYGISKKGFNVYGEQSGRHPRVEIKFQNSDEPIELRNEAKEIKIDYKMGYVKLRLLCVDESSDPQRNSLISKLVKPDEEASGAKKEAAKRSFGTDRRPESGKKKLKGGEVLTRDIDLYLMSVEPRYPKLAGDGYYFYYTGYVPRLEAPLKESLIYYKVVIAAFWGQHKEKKQEDLKFDIVFP